MRKKWIWWLMILPVMLIILGFAAYFGYTVWQTDGQKGPQLTQKQKEALEKVAVFQEETTEHEYRNVGEFIADYHEWYNKTLGWGGIDSVEWKEQQVTATEILNVLTGIQTDDLDLQADFKKIENYARAIEGGKKEKQPLLYLHRYFHDLDIEFNGYKQSKDYYNITKFKARND